MIEIMIYLEIGNTSRYYEIARRIIEKGKKP